MSCRESQLVPLSLSSGPPGPWRVGGGAQLRACLGRGKLAIRDGQEGS